MSISRVGDVVGTTANFTGGAAHSFARCVRVRMRGGMLCTISYRNTGLSVFELGIRVRSYMLRIPIVGGFTGTSIFIRLRRARARVVMHAVRNRGRLPGFGNSCPS